MRVTAASQSSLVFSQIRPRGLLAAAAAALVLAACDAGQIEAPDSEIAAAGSGENALIRDQNHNGGTAGFAFLAPIVQSPPKSSGQFEGRLAPEVRIDQLDSSGAVAKNVVTYTASRRTYNSKVRRNLSKEFYVVRLDSSRVNLDTRSTYRIRVAVGGKELGYADIDVVSTQAQANRVNRSAYVPLVRGRTLPIRFRIETSAVDQDGDGVFDWLDNCPTVKNPPVRVSSDSPRATGRASWSCNPDVSECDPQEQDCNPATFTQPDSDGDGIGDACECSPGFSGGGSSPCTDIDECMQQPVVCDALTQCTNTPGSFTCSACPAGYTGTGETKCTDIDECSAMASPCAPQVTCTNTAGSYTCGPCPAGTMGDGHTCMPTEGGNPGAGGLTITTVTPPADDANYRTGNVTIGWAAPMAGQYASYQLKCSLKPLDVTMASPAEQDAWWTNAHAVALPAGFAPPASSVSLKLRAGERNNCVLRGVDAQGQLSALITSSAVELPFRTHTMKSSTSGHETGFDFAAVGDVDGDGLDDLLVAGYTEAYLVFGRSGGVTAATPDVTFVGSSSAYLEFRAASIGDFNGDGRNDFVLGAPSDNGGNGRAFVFYGRASRDWPAMVDISSGCNADLCFDNTGGGQVFGATVESAGDFNGDGTADLLVAGPLYPSDTDARGRMFILLGKAYEAGLTKTGPFFGHAIEVPGSSELQGFSATGDGTDLVQLGFAAAALGPFDSTPGDDLVVSALGKGTTISGKVLFLSGRPYSGTGLVELTRADFGARDAGGTPSGTWFAEAENNEGEHFGFGVYALGNVYDVAGAPKKGVPDIAIWRFSSSGFYVYPGDNGFNTADRISVNAALRSDTYLGISVGTGRLRGDLDGDGIAEICATSDLDPVSGSSPGTGQLWYSDTFAAGVGGQPKVIDTFSASPIIATTATDMQTRVIEFAGDLNGDGKLDLVIGTPQVNMGSGEFTLLY